MPLKPDADRPAIPASSGKGGSAPVRTGGGSGSPESRLPAPPHPTGSRPASDAPGPRDLPWRRALAALLACGLLGLAVPGLAALLGEDFREAVLVEVETDPGPSEPAWSDAPMEAARFFSERDTMTVVVPRDMTLARFLALHHLETHTGAREAIREQLGLSEPSDLLREGDRVTLPLTLRRERP